MKAAAFAWFDLVEKRRAYESVWGVTKPEYGR